MIIRKSFRFENAHMVRNCSTHRCRSSIHGHSYLIELFVTADHLDDAGMIVDFSLLKGEVKSIIDTLDHTYIYWSQENDEYKGFIHKFSDRWIEFPVSPSCEWIAATLFFFIDLTLRHTTFANGEGTVELSSIRVHETATGYAECFRHDKAIWGQLSVDQYRFSPGVLAEMNDPELFEKLKGDHLFQKQPPPKQI